MPLTFGIPIGLFIVLIGAIMLYSMKNKLAGGIVLIIGALIFLFTLIMVILAVTTQM